MIGIHERPFTALFLILVLSIVNPCVAGSTTPHAIALETPGVKYLIGADGKNAGLIDKRSGKDYGSPSSALPFALLTRAGKTSQPTSCTLAGGKLILQFHSPDATLVLKVLPRERYFVFEVESLSDPAVEKLTLINLLNTFKHSSGISGVAGDADFAVALRTLDRETVGQVGSTIAAVRARKDGFAGSKVALAAAPASEIRTLLKAVIHDEGLPESPLGGPWALDAPENRGSYVFAYGLSEANVEQWIALAQKAGLAQLHFCDWEQSLGHYEPRKAYFPKGMAGLKATVDKIHAAGLRAGMHTLTGGIAPHDPWITPRADQRLASDARLTLAAALDEKTTSVPTLEQPGEFETVWAYSGRGNVIRIGEELIQYSALERGRPYGFVQCKRGAFGTKPARHEKGTAVDHLFVRYGLFQPDPDSTLVDDVATAIARMFNTCGFDMIYMDGAEGMAGGEAGVARMREAIFRRLKGRVLVEASEWGYPSWSFHSRIGAWDHPTWGLKRFIDLHCRSNEDHRRNVLLPAQLGWWSILGPTANQPAEFPDEIEYLCCKALATDAPLSFQGISPGKQSPNARQDEYLELVGRYERLRLANTVSPAVRQRLRAEGEDFRLVQSGDGGCAFVPTDYAAHKVTGLDDGTHRWTVENRYGEQAVQMRIEALYGVEPYDSPDALVLSGFARAGEVVAEDSAPGVKQAFGLSREQVRGSGPSGRFWAQNDGPSRAGAWARAVRAFTPEANLKKHGALGVWIHGDGKGEIINFQLTNPTYFWPTFDEHYVKVDFKGWRYFALLLRERDADRHGDFTWPYHNVSAIYRSTLIQDHTSALNLYYNDLPPKESVTCYLGPIKALPTRKLTLRNPALAINGRRIQLPVTLESGAYLEAGSDGACKVYDERGALRQTLPPPGDMPVLRAGRNEVEFTCVAAADAGARAKVTIISGGEPIR